MATTKKRHRVGRTRRDFRAGDVVNVRGHESKPGKGLSYDPFSGRLLEDAGAATGWDVVDVDVGPYREPQSIYAFDIEKKVSRRGSR